MSSSEFRKRKEEINGRIDETIDNLQKGHDECARVEKYFDQYQIYFR